MVSLDVLLREISNKGPQVVLAIGFAGLASMFVWNGYQEYKKEYKKYQKLKKDHTIVIYHMEGRIM